MTDPGQHEQGWQQQPPQYPQHPQPPQYPQAQYPQPGQYPQTAQYPQMPQGGTGYGPAFPAQQAPKNRRGLIVGLVIALVAAVGGGATWLALALSGDTGAASPSEAADNLMSAFTEADLIGMADSLAPAESAVLSDAINNYSDELKRLEILDQAADPGSLSGIEVDATDELVFDASKQVKLNDHVTLAAITGGKLTITPDFDQIPFAKSFKDAVFPPQLQAQLRTSSEPHVEDLSERYRITGEPLYVATVNVDGEWYPSLFHTVAYYALKKEGKQWPSTPIQAVGASTPQQALEQLIEAVRTTDIEKVLQILPPDEMAVLHDIGPLIVERVNAHSDSAEDLPFELVSLETDKESIDGGTRLALRSFEARVTENGESHVFGFRKDGECATVTVDGQTNRMCAKDLAAQMRSDIPDDIPPQAVEPIIEIMQALFASDLGIVTVEVDGKHYVSPLRTGTDLGLTMLKAVEPEHVRALIAAFQ